MGKKRQQWWVEGAPGERRKTGAPPEGLRSSDAQLRWERAVRSGRGGPGQGAWSWGVSPGRMRLLPLQFFGGARAWRERHPVLFLDEPEHVPNLPAAKPEPGGVGG